MSKNTKQILTVLAVALAFCIIGGAAALGGAGLIFERFKDNVSTDPEKVRQTAHEFINYELPSGYNEQMGMDFLIYKMVLIAGDDFNNDDTPVLKPLIFLAHFESEDLTPEQMAQQMQQSVERQSGSGGLKLKVVETRSVSINGDDAQLTISEGSDSNGHDYRQWVTAFPGKTGLIIVMIQGRTDQWDNTIFNDFLSSISF